MIVGYDTNSTENNNKYKVLRQWGLMTGVGSALIKNNTESTKNAATTDKTEDEKTFLDSKTRGIIKIIPDDDTKSIEFLAEDVTVSKILPLSTATDLQGSNTSVDTAQQEGGSTIEESAQFVISCKITITPRGLTNEEFKQKRANYLFDFEDKTFTVVSDMFRKAISMQFTSLEYVIPAGERSAQYKVEMTQVEEVEDDRATEETGVTTIDKVDTDKSGGVSEDELNRASSIESGVYSPKTK